MKKKRMSQVLGILLTLGMVAGMTACGSQNEATKTESKTESKTTQSAADTKTASTENSAADTADTTEITYPLQTEDTLTIWSKNQIKPSTAYTDYTESPFHTGLAEMTGVEVEWSYPAEGANADQAYNLLLTEEVLPDIIFTSITAGEAAELLEDGLIYDLTEYLPVYAPDYWEVLHQPEYESVLQTCTTDEGKFYSFESWVEGMFNMVYMGPIVRQDWLDECGLEAPVTMDDWEEVLIAFKEKYDTAPFGFFLARINNNGIGSGTGAYATFSVDNGFYVDENQQIQMTQATEEWKAYMEYLHRWWEMGLIDQDSLTMDDAAIRTKALNNKIGITFTATGQSNMIVSEAKEAGNGAEWVGIDYPRTAAGEPTCMVQARYSYGFGWGAMVTTSCSEEKLITALKWLNYGYTEEGRMYWNYGKEGVSYTLDENGEPQWTELITEDPDGVLNAVTKYVGTDGTGISIQASHMVDCRIEGYSSLVSKWIDNTVSMEHCVPTLSLTVDEQTRYSDLISPIRTYVEQMGLKFMTGDESLDNFDAFVAELKEMGLDEVLEIKQAAYDRFLEKIQ